MDWIELTIHTTTAGADIVSEALMAEGATGTMVEDRADIPDPDKPNGYWEIIDPNLIASMPEDVLVHAWFTPDSSFVISASSFPVSSAIYGRSTRAFSPMDTANASAAVSVCVIARGR